MISASVCMCVCDILSNLPWPPHLDVLAVHLELRLLLHSCFGLGLHLSCVGGDDLQQLIAFPCGVLHHNLCVHTCGEEDVGGWMGFQGLGAAISGAPQALALVIVCVDIQGVLLLVYLAYTVLKQTC
eukprot:1158274-Pelagomonas_calceolata.AAC.45